MRKVIVGGVCLAVALAGLVFVIPLALSSDALRTALARQLSDSSGAQVSLSGPIRFSVLPDFGVVAEDLSYVSGDGAISISAARSVASVELMSLFSDQIRITGIELQSPRIVLAEASQAESSTEPEPATQGQDIFEVAAGYLERLAIDHLDVIGGEVAQNREGAIEPIASDIDLRLSVPGISEPASLAVSGTVDGNRMELAADIGSLRDLLNRQPATFSLSAKNEQPPHPILADLAASGSIQLAQDGSYRITGGEIDSIGQTMRLDVSYAPGDRPFVMARVEAGVLDYSDWQPAEANAGASETAQASSDGVDLSALRGFDADIELRAEAMQAGQAIARDVIIGAQLQNGELNANVSSSEIAGGSLDAGLLVDLNSDRLQSSGTLDIASIDMENLMALAGQTAPATGQLSSQLGYAFFGMDAEAIRNSINLRGEVSISNGRIEAPQLADVAGSGAGIIDALDATARIEDIRQPLAVSGTAQWNGETIGFDSTLALADLLMGQPGTAALDFRSPPVNANFSGTVALNGAASGRAEISAASLSRALGWFGQDTGTPLGRFAFSGDIAVSDTEFALSEAAIGLDDINAGGSLSVTRVGKPKVTAALSVDMLDFTRLTGGSTTAAPTSSGPSDIDLAILRQFDADIRLTANQIGYGSIKAGPATASLSVADGVARLSVPEAAFYGGGVTANVTANGAGDVPAIELVAGMEGVESLPFLIDAAGFEHIEGKLTANVQVSGAGNNSEAFARSLKGPVSVMFSDGAVRGIDVAGLVRNVQSLINGGYTENADAKTEFAELSVSVGIENGVGRFDDLRLLGPLVRMSGQGNIDLAAQTIDVRLDPRVVGSLDGQGGEFDVSGLGMPVIVTGALAGPSIYPDVSGILANPDQALQAISQLGGNIGQLAAGASEVDLESVLGDGTDAISDSVLTGLIGGLAGSASGEANGVIPANGQDLLNTILGERNGEQAVQVPEAPAQPAGMAPETESIAALPADPFPLPRQDPRTGQAVVSEVAQEPAEQPDLTDRLFDAVAPQVAPNNVDSIRNLLEQLGAQ
ncbi:AsmA family protein [Pelagibacterium sp. 26DY04]|uniref:AsmA family protein n=1 Tax=Pelagibacterium sp. 26DY04 TaxID=2967130 RepID=UPI002814B50A|nr:AsmA family protein [Pelagibacterium sp. 26DY04]WMT86385.1 AsmA family protein [Pelagibacterium sp. 26DY04]